MNKQVPKAPLVRSASWPETLKPEMVQKNYRDLLYDPSALPRYPDQTPMSLEAVAALPDDGYRYEWWNGVLQVPPSPSPSHQDCLGLFYSHLLAYFLSTQSGRIILDIDIEIPGKALVRPDFVFFLGEKAKQVPRHRTVSFAPDGVGEILSPGGE